MDPQEFERIMKRIRHNLKIIEADRQAARDRARKAAKRRALVRGGLFVVLSAAIVATTMD